jgi:hypothetical protein
MLPDGYVVLSKKEREKMKKDREDSKKDERTIEEIIEEERAALPNSGLTPVTAETFAAWKKRRAEQKQKDLEEKVKQAEVKTAKAKAMKGSKTHGVMNGRALFTYNPNLFKDDENAGDANTYEEEKN